MEVKLLILHLLFGLFVASNGEEKEEDEDKDVFLTNEDFKRAKDLKPSDLYQIGKPGAWIQKTYFHSDVKRKVPNSQDSTNRNGVKLDNDKWPSGVIPYVISNRFSSRERAILARAFQTYHDRTCIRFVPRDPNRHIDYLAIGKIDGCFSDVGRAGGRQELSLDIGCIEYDTAIHELMHAVGFWHEHERWDRDSWININWPNIERDAYDQFGKVNLFESFYYGENYDYLSIMHYDSKSFTKNGGNTMDAMQPQYTYLMGRVKDFSTVDLRKINKMYNCPNHGNNNNQFVHQNHATNHFPRPQQVKIAGPTNNAIASSNCFDKATLCWKWVARCRTHHFQQIMQEFCAATCGFCRQQSFSGNFNRQTNNRNSHWQG